MTIVLTLEEVAQALKAVADRMTESAKAQLNHATTYKRDLRTRVNEEFVGACGEIAWAKANGRKWRAPINEFHVVPDDVETGYEVRSTSLDNGSLIIRDNDPDDRVYVLMTGNGFSMTVQGCLTGREAKRPQFERNPNGYRPAWFVPQSALKSVKL